jgi:hypothetical protein
MFSKRYSKPELKKCSDNNDDDDDKNEEEEEEDVVIYGNDCVNAVKLRINFSPHFSTIAPRVTICVPTETCSWPSSPRCQSCSCV